MPYIKLWNREKSKDFTSYNICVEELGIDYDCKAKFSDGEVIIERTSKYALPSSIYTFVREEIIMIHGKIFNGQFLLSDFF